LRGHLRCPRKTESALEISGRVDRVRHDQITRGLNSAGRHKEGAMKRKSVERRTVLKGGAAAVGLLGGGVSSELATGVDRALADTPQSELPQQMLTAVRRFRETIPANFDRDYVEKAVIPFFLTSLYEGERPMLPMIGVNFSKENALPYD